MKLMEIVISTEGLYSLLLLKVALFIQKQSSNNILWSHFFVTNGCWLFGVCCSDEEPEVAGSDVRQARPLTEIYTQIKQDVSFSPMG